MRYNGPKRGFATLLAALALAGCTHPAEEVPIPPLPAVGSQSGASLGPGVRPITAGPGYKGSPAWSPEGDQVAFIIDGYVVDKPIAAGDVRRWTTKDFRAEEAEWVSGEGLAILSAGPVGADETSKILYRAGQEEGSLGVKELAKDVRAMSPLPSDGGMVVAFDTGPYRSGLALLHGNGEVDRVYTSTIQGSVTGISLSPDGRKAALAVRTPGPYVPYEVHVFDLKRGEDRRIARLSSSQEIFGAPQLTDSGAFYVAGEAGTSESGGTALYDLYRVPADPEKELRPEPAPGVGEDFVAASIRVSPDGSRLAVIGRLNPKAPINLYILDPTAEGIEAVTTNEDMDIKAEPDDLAWSPGGESVAIVARGAPSGEPRVRAAPAETLLEDFYNLYEVPVRDTGAAHR